MKVAGKTGTSQVVKLDENRKRKMGYQYQDHALFVAFAPFDKPEIAVAVVAEHGGGGGAVAAPIANRILRQYFDLKKPAPPRPRAEEDGDHGDPEQAAPAAIESPEEKPSGREVQE